MPWCGWLPTPGLYEATQVMAVSCHVAGRSACHRRFAHGIGGPEERACLSTKPSLSSRKKVASFTIDY